MAQNKHEVDFYPEIISFLNVEMDANLSQFGSGFKCYFAVGNFQKGLKDIIKSNNLKIEELNAYAAKAKPLLLDIFAVVIKENKYQIVIFEVKHLSTAGLTQLSQLIGYCMVSYCKFGVLVNVDGKSGGFSDQLSSIIRTDSELCEIKRIKKNNETIETKLGIMNWNSTTKNMEYSNLGKIVSISDLCSKIAESIK